MVQGELSLEYLPLRVGEVTGRLELTAPELGSYPWDVTLHATRAGPERAIYLRACLGTSASQTAKFLNFAKQRTDYKCKVSGSFQ